ncbi:IclR family transcriptional regulator, partial [Pseudomonas aeruginosa]
MTEKRVNETALRVLRVLIALKGHTLTGLSNGEVAKALGES